MPYLTVQPLPAAYYDGVMFSYKDREVLARLEAKIDVALNRVSEVERKHGAHEATCEGRNRNFEDYARRKETENQRMLTELERIEDSFRVSHNTLMWKVVGAMFILLIGSVSAVWSLVQHGVIR